MQHLKVLNNGHPYIGFFLHPGIKRIDLIFNRSWFQSPEKFAYDNHEHLHLNGGLLWHSKTVNSTEKSEIMYTQIQGSLLKTQGGFPQLKGSTCWKHIPSKYHPYMAASSKTHIHRFPCFWIPELAWRDPKNCSYWHTANDVRKNEVTPNTCAAAGVTEGRRRMGYSSPGIALENPARWLEGFRQDLR